MTEPLEFILCADDFGISPGVSEGILDLVKTQRLSAVGCMMNRATIKDQAAKLNEHRGAIDIGIHLVLTDLAPLTNASKKMPSIARLTKNSFFGGLVKLKIKTELTAQLDLFESLFGHPPNFIDGHHHIQQLPGIRDIVLSLIDNRYAEKKPHIRSGHENFSRIFRRGVDPLKALAISFFGKGLQDRAAAKGISFNDGFSGIYDLSGKVPYGKLFDHFTDHLRPGSLIMCHPGKVDEILRSLDKLTDQRETELAYFLSEDFIHLLARKKLRLGRFSTAK